MSLTEDEYTVLMLAAEGQSIASIGRWKQSCDSLVGKGYLHRHDVANSVITQAGAAALRTHENNLGADLANAVAITSSAREMARMSAEQAVTHLLIAARASVPATGDPLPDAIRKWGNEIIASALRRAESEK